MAGYNCRIMKPNLKPRCQQESQIFVFEIELVGDISIGKAALVGIHPFGEPFGRKDHVFYSSRIGYLQ